MILSSTLILEATSPAKFDGSNNNNQFPYSVSHSSANQFKGDRNTNNFERRNSMDEGVSVASSSIMSLSFPISTITTPVLSTKTNNFIPLANSLPSSPIKNHTNNNNYPSANSSSSSSPLTMSPPSSSRKSQHIVPSSSTTTTITRNTTISKAKLKSLCLGSEDSNISNNNNRAKINLLKNMLNQFMEGYKVTQAELQDALQNVEAERKEKEKLQDEVRSLKAQIFPPQFNMMSRDIVSSLPPKRRWHQDSSITYPGRSRSSSRSSTTSSSLNNNNHHHHHHSDSRRSESPPQLSPAFTPRLTVSSSKNHNNKRYLYNSYSSHPGEEGKGPKSTHFSFHPSSKVGEFDGNDSNYMNDLDDNVDELQEEYAGSNKNHRFQKSNYFNTSNCRRKSGLQNNSQEYDFEESPFDVSDINNSYKSNGFSHYHQFKSQQQQQHQQQYSNYKTIKSNFNTTPSTRTTTTCTQVVKTLSRPKPNIKITDMVTENRVVHAVKKSNVKMNSPSSAVQPQYGKNDQSYDTANNFNRLRQKLSSQLKEKNQSHAIYQQQLKGNNNKININRPTHSMRGNMRRINSKPYTICTRNHVTSCNRTRQNSILSSQITANLQRKRHQMSNKRMLKKDSTVDTLDEDQQGKEIDDDEDDDNTEAWYMDDNFNQNRNFQISEEDDNDDDDEITLVDRRRRHSSLSHQISSGFLRSENHPTYYSSNLRNNRLNSAEATSSIGTSKRISQQVRHSLPHISDSSSKGSGNVSTSDHLSTTMHRHKIVNHGYKPRSFLEKIDYSAYYNEEGNSSSVENSSTTTAKVEKRKQDTININNNNNSSGSMKKTRKSSTAVVPVKDNALALKVHPSATTTVPTNQIKEIPEIFVIRKSDTENCMTAQVPYHFYESEANAEKGRQQLLEMEKDDCKDNSKDDVRSKISPMINSKMEEKFVEIPQWRLRILEAKKAEVDENLDDQVFLKRHSKSEVNERRRKRWDSQRLREESYFEKLKRKQEEREMQKIKKRRRRTRGGEAQQNYKEDEEENTFQPSVRDARSIRVEDDIPISVFGYTLPIIDEDDFALPWNISQRKPLQGKTASSSHRSAVTSSSTTAMKQSSGVKALSREGRRRCVQ